MVTALSLYKRYYFPELENSLAHRSVFGMRITGLKLVTGRTNKPKTWRHGDSGHVAQHPFSHILTTGRPTVSCIAESL